MAHYGYLDGPTMANAVTANGSGRPGPSGTRRNGHQQQPQPPSRGHRRSVCGFSAGFIVLTLYIFNFILFAAGLVMAGTAIFYRSGYVEYTGENREMSTIRALLPLSHPYNIVHHAMLLCATMILALSILTWASSCCGQPTARSESKSSIDKNSNQNGNTGPISASSFDMEILTSSDEEDEGGDEDEIVAFSNGHRRTSCNGSGVQRRSSSSSRKSYQRRKERITVSSCFMCFFIFALLLLFTIQLTIGLVGFMAVNSIRERHLEQQQLDTTVQNQQSPLLAAIKRYRERPNNDVLVANRHHFDRLQPKFKCCGLVDFNDYLGRSGQEPPVPTSCCKSATGPNCGLRRHPSNIYYDGCLLPLEAAIKDQLVILSSLALGLSIVEVFGLVFAGCLYCLLLASKPAPAADTRRV